MLNRVLFYLVIFMLGIATAYNAYAADADSEYMQEMKTMHKSMDVTMTGDADKDFVAMMIPHHAGAVEMAKTELKYGKDPKVRQLAQDIIQSQDAQINFMTDWQKKQ